MFPYIKVGCYIYFILFYECKYINLLILNGKYDIDLFVLSFLLFTFVKPKRIAVSGLFYVE